MSDCYLGRRSHGTEACMRRWKQIGVSLEKTLGGGGGEDDVGAQQLLLLLVESLQGGETRDVSQVGEGEGVISTHPQVTSNILIITDIAILKQRKLNMIYFRNYKQILLASFSHAVC